METLTPLDSSSIAWVGYDRPNRVLHVRFKGNDLEYEYTTVSPKEWTALRKAESKGQYINFHIKPNHDLSKPK